MERVQNKLRKSQAIGAKMFVLMLRHCCNTWMILAVALTTTTGLSAQIVNNPPHFEVRPVPSWVKPIEPGSDIEVGADNAGMVYLLADRQENVERGAYYYHEVRKITAENGLQDGASISALFDSRFTRVIFHSIKLTRNGTASDRLDRSRIKLLPRETDPERSLFDHFYRAQTVLDDVRVGDVIEFAFTREGVDPSMRGKYSKIFVLQWDALILRNVLRLVYPTNRKLAFRTDNGARQPHVTSANGLTELWYEDHNVPGRIIEDDVPDDYEPRQRLDISEFSNWAEFAQWAMPLFDTGVSHSALFEAETAKLRSIADREQRVLAALQFVQNQIRYVKMRALLDALPLTAPDEVMRRGFANRTEKALLLLALLRRSEIEAAVGLVSGSFRAKIRELLPSSDVVDDAIVQVCLGESTETTHWLNPAASDQRGPLSQVYVPTYSYALVLHPGTNDLTPFQPPSESFPVKKVIENYRVLTPGKAAELEVISEYRGLAADRTRRFFRENKREEIEKTYLEYYTRMFPDVKAQKALWYEELPGENACRLTESYTVPRLWQLNDEKSRYSLYVQPLEMYSALGSTISPQRRDPFKLEYPNTVTEQVNVEMFEDWPLNAEGAIVNNEFFQLRDEPSDNGATLQFGFSYAAKKDRVDVADIDKFNEAISKAKDMLGYTLRYQTPEQIKKAKSLSTFNWAVAASVFCFFATANFLAYTYFRHSKLAQQLPPPVDAPARLNGIGGWLILLAIGQVLLPLRFAKPTWDVLSLSTNTSSWRSLTDPIESSYHPLWAPTLLFELFLNVGAFIFALLLIALFFTKKAAWRRAFALFFIFFLLGAVVDTVLLDRIPSAAEPVLTSVAELVPIVVAAAIWIPYVSFSKRVKATFRY